MSQPLDEDGFHSIAWDDAPPRRSQNEVMSPLEEPEDDFETISPSAISPAPDQQSHQIGQSQSQGQGSSSRLDSNANVDPADWGGKWMTIQVKDPVREHEGSKDQYVSYAVRTMVSVTHKGLN